ncbi:MAG: response regulator transcription factor [Acidobacteriota bacterium]
MPIAPVSPVSQEIAAPPIRVLLVDDHALVRTGLAMLIAVNDDMIVVGEAEQAAEALELARELQPDIVVLDISLPPGDSGLRIIESIRRDSPSSHVLVLTMHDDYTYLRAALAAGTSGYVVKTAADRELISAIRTLHQGRTYISVSFGHGDPLDPDAEPKPAADPPPELSQRETQVLEYVAYGYTSGQIADRLRISTKTVDGYRSRMADKLGLRTRAELVRYALEKGILDRNRPPPFSDGSDKSKENN